MSLEGRVTALEETIPNGYRTFDKDGNPVIASDLPALEWLTATEEFLRRRGHRDEKAELLWKLRTSTGVDGGGGLLYQVVCALVRGFFELEELRELAVLALKQHDCPKNHLREFLGGFICPEELEGLCGEE